jgi:hypothetical protein
MRQTINRKCGLWLLSGGSSYSVNHASQVFPWCTAPNGPGPPHYRGFMITGRHTALGRTPLDGWSARRRDLYLTMYSTHKTQTSLPPAEVKPVIPGSKWPQTHALDRAATGIGTHLTWCLPSLSIYPVWFHTTIYSYMFPAISGAVRRLHDNSHANTWINEHCSRSLPVQYGISHVHVITRILVWNFLAENPHWIIS